MKFTETFLGNSCPHTLAPYPRAQTATKYAKTLHVGERLQGSMRKTKKSKSATKTVASWVCMA